MAGKKAHAVTKRAPAPERKQRGRVDRSVMFPVPPPASDAPPDYTAWLADLKSRIRQERLRVVLASNAVMVLLYWDLGRSILDKQADQGWGSRVIDRLSADLRDAFPEMNGFSPRNLKYMRAFAAAWPDRQIVQASLAQLTCQAAMRGALEIGGKAVGILADSLERAALNREHRNLLMHGQLVLVSPYDPSVGFNVRNAMQRNKLIYALADAALVVNSDYNKGGTWSGAVEQLEKLHLVPVYVRSNGEMGKGLEALVRKGALPWPNPDSAEAFDSALAVPVPGEIPNQEQLSLATVREHTPEYGAQNDTPVPVTQVVLSVASPPSTPAEELFAKVRSLLEKMDMPKTDIEVATELGVSKNQAKEWLQRLVKEGALEKISKPVRYCSTRVPEQLF